MTDASPARRAVFAALVTAAAQFPDIDADLLDPAGLSPRDRGFAVALYRTTLQRWLTLERVLGKFTREPVAQTRPELRAAMLMGAAALLFMPGQPAHAVLDESVELAKRATKKRSAGVVNAVLRKVAKAVGGYQPDSPWTPAPDALPFQLGRVTLTAPLLPHADHPANYLAAVFSVPRALMRGWVETHGLDAAIAIGHASIRTPATWTFDEHDQPATFDHAAGDLVEWLAQDARRRVQDFASAQPVRSLVKLVAEGKLAQPTRILDLCAGRGTKTRQLRAAFPDAAITAFDPDARRRVDLAAVPGVQVIDDTGALPARPGFDLVLLDVPCSNTGVLARRPEARYRFSPNRMESLRALQRQIIGDALPRVADGGAVLYATCSLEPTENGEQARWLMEQVDGAELVHESLVLPSVGNAGDPAFPGHDGSYHAAVAWPRGSRRSPGGPASAS